jgi:hypothetical protein
MQARQAVDRGNHRWAAAAQTRAPPNAAARPAPARQAFVGDAPVTYGPGEAPWLAGGEAAADAARGGVADAAADAERRPSPAAARARWQDERGAAAPPGGGWRGARGRRATMRGADAPRPEGEVGPGDVAHDGGGAFTCDPYTPGVDALPANATLIKRPDLPAPLRLPGGFTSVAQPSADDVIALVARAFNLSASSLRLAAKGPPPDATDALGMRHVRLEQVEQYMGDWYGVEYGSLVAHLRAGPGGAPELYMVTGGYIDDVAARIGAGSRRVRPPVSESADGGGGSGSGPVDAARAASISLDAALNGAPVRRGGAATRRGGLVQRRSYLSRATALRAARAAAAPGGSPAAESEEEGPDEPAAARGAPERVIYCAADGGCYPTWRQPVFVPAGYLSDAAPQELHVYVSAEDGRVLARHDRLRTWAGRAAGGAAGDAHVGVAGDSGGAGGAARRLQQAVDPPPLLPPSAYVKPRSDTPESRAAADAINAALAARYDGPSMRATQGVGSTLYSGTVLMDTAEVTRLTRRGTKVSDGYVLTDLKRLGQKTYDLKGQAEPNRDASAKGQDVKDRSNFWWGAGSGGGVGWMGLRDAAGRARSEWG